MSNSTAEAPSTPAEVCGYAVDSTLSGATGKSGETFLAIGPGGRGVVLKALDEDCLVKAPKGSHGLHPSIRDRLGRVRELAHVGVANLFGVERDAGRAWMIWEYVPGQTFDAYASAPGRTPRELATAARELVTAVDALHVQGVIHGAIKPGNVLITPGGAVRLTHVSPYLYVDPAVDAGAVLTLLEEALFARHEERSALAKLLMAVQDQGATEGPPSLRVLASRLAVFLAAREGDVASQGDLRRLSRRGGQRGRSMASAVAVALVGAAAAYGGWRLAGRPPLQLPRALQRTLDMAR